MDRSSVQAKVKVLLVMGTRPEVIKLAPLVHELRGRTHAFEVKICMTGQHRELARQARQAFDLAWDFDLDVMEEDQSLGHTAFLVMRGLESVLSDWRPEMVLVQGDTVSAFCGATTAFYEGLPVGHVEAGLRSDSPFDPFPEEGNRRMIDVVATWHFAPTESNRRSLLREGFADSTIHVTGNTGIDAFQYVSRKTRDLPGGPPELSRLGLVDSICERGRRLVVITLHRRESFGERLASALDAIRFLAESNPSWAFVFPVHPNPNVRHPVEVSLRGLDNVVLLDPLPYLDFVWLTGRATVVITDSGGIQEEVASLGTQTIVLRETTERTEGLESGVCVLAGGDGRHLLGALGEDLERCLQSPTGPPAFNPYGDGRASRRIADVLERASRARSI